MHLPFPRCWRFLTPDIPKVCNAPPDRHHWNIFHGTERRKRTTFFVSFLGYSPLQCILGSKTMSIEWFAVWASNSFFHLFFFQRNSFKSVHSASKFTFFGQSFLLLMWLMKKDSMAFNAFLTLPHPLDKTLEFSTVHRYMYRCSTFVQELHNIVEMFSKFEWMMFKLALDVFQKGL